MAYMSRKLLIHKPRKQVKKVILGMAVSTFALLFQVIRAAGNRTLGNILIRSYMHRPAAHYEVCCLVSSVRSPSHWDSNSEKKNFN